MLKISLKKAIKMPMKLISILLLATVGLTSCSSNNVASDNIVVKTHIAEPNKVRFSGKGAGAGMMLMSSMGPMGIAIGVAIDEGIANDIEKTAKASELDIAALISQQLSSVLKVKARTKTFEMQLANEITIDILRYGFITHPGEGDLVTAQLHLDIKLQDSSWLTVKYPEQLTKVQQKKIKTSTLENVKHDEQIINDLFNHAIQHIARILTQQGLDETVYRS